jgi:hypothetical protein
MSEWNELNGLEDVARAKVCGWEIEVYDPTTERWEHWHGAQWVSCADYRGRPKQPQEVTYECFSIDGRLVWRDQCLSVSEGWIRIPELDKTIRVTK